jgi:hypothetical protein
MPSATGSQPMMSVFQYGARRTGCHQNKNIQIFKEQFLVRTKTKNPRNFWFLGFVKN